MHKVGLLIIATNKYIKYIQQLITSADLYFLNNQDVTYFIFSDQDISIESKRSIKSISVEHRDWPWMTLGRYQIFHNAKEELSQMDYLYYCDVDMRFVNDVGNEILSDRVATVHPGYLGGRGTPETRKESLAYIADDEHMSYFAGGFNGGTSSEYLSMAQVLSQNINIDHSQGLIAIWHDESHLNRYFVNRKPSKILDPSYCYGESMNIPFDKKLIALDKDHADLRDIGE